MKGSLKYLQINLQHSRATSSALRDELIRRKSWRIVKELAQNVYHVFYITRYERPRALLLLWNLNLNFALVTEFTVVELLVGTGRRSIIFASAYFPGDGNDASPEKVKSLIDWCSKGGKTLLWIATPQPGTVPTWRKADVSLILFLFFWNFESLFIINRENKPIFMTAIRPKVLNLIIETHFTAQTVRNW